MWSDCLSQTVGHRQIFDWVIFWITKPAWHAANLLCLYGKMCQFHCLSQKLQYHSQSVEQKNVSKFSCSRFGQHHSLPFRMKLASLIREKKTMPLTLFCSCISYNECMYISQKAHIHPVCVGIACHKEALKRRNIYCLLFWDKMYVMFLSRQKGNITYFLLLIQWSLLILFQIIVYHPLSIVCWVIHIWQPAQPSMLLTFFKQVRCGARQCCITHSLSIKTGLTGLLTIIDWLTCYWSYDAPWDHLPKTKIKCHSLPVDYGTTLLITKESITHKLLS